MKATLTLRLKNQESRTVPDRSRHKAPLTFSWKPAKAGEPIVVYLINQAGLCLGGDYLVTKIELRNNAHAIVTPQSYTKVARGNGTDAVEEMYIRLNDGCTLEWLGEPSMVFPKACSHQITTLEMSPQNHLIWISGQVLGRIARGERLSFKAWRHRFKVFLRSELVFLESWLLEPSRSKKALEVLLEDYSVMGLALFSSPSMDKAFCAQMVEFSRQQGTGRRLLAGFSSPIPSLTVVRFLASDGQMFRDFSRLLWETSRSLLLGCAPPHLGKF